MGEQVIMRGKVSLEPAVDTTREGGIYSSISPIVRPFPLLIAA